MAVELQAELVRQGWAMPERKRYQSYPLIWKTNPFLRELYHCVTGADLLAEKVSRGFSETSWNCRCFEYRYGNKQAANRRGSLDNAGGDFFCSSWRQSADRGIATAVL